MPRIFEVFGRTLTDDSPGADADRRSGACPFRTQACDGGGNRYLSHVHLAYKPELSAYFGRRSVVPSGVCSLQLHPEHAPWIVCPRRLLAFPGSAHRDGVIALLCRHSGYERGSTVGVWAEVKVEYTQNLRSFDYTFDYIVTTIGTRPLDAAATLLGLAPAAAESLLRNGGYRIADIRGTRAVLDFPTGPPVVVEIMTSSTSGGNQTKRTTIPLAFEDAILGRPHRAPGINYRQVWARMVSQLIVKSEAANAWGGKAIWILQDVLIDYISSTTALDVRRFRADRTSEVNILGFSYGNHYNAPASGAVLELGEGTLYAGPISVSGHTASEPAFEDMIRAPVCPPRSALLRRLAQRRFVESWIIP